MNVGEGLLVVPAGNRVAAFDYAATPRTPTLTPTVTATVTPVSGRVVGTARLQGRPTPPSTALLGQLTLEFTTSGSPPPFTAHPQLDALGNFTVEAVPPGTYQLRLKHPQGLSMVLSMITVTSGASVSVGPFVLPSGDADNNDQIDILDFSILRADFGGTAACSTANPPSPSCADFDANGGIDIVDFSLLRSNFGLQGPVTSAGVGVNVTVPSGTARPTAHPTLTPTLLLPSRA
jgi:hypothetical protein